MKRIDEQKIKIDVAGNSNDKYKELNEDRLESVIAQKENTKRVLQRKTAQLKRRSKQTTSRQKCNNVVAKHLPTLTWRCENSSSTSCENGCTPSETELEMRKLKLDNIWQCFF